MNSEYVKLSRPEILYSQKNILLAVLELLKTTKNLKNYKDLRKEEFAIKISLKSKIEEAQRSLALLDRALPESNFKIPELKEKHLKKEIERLVFKKERPSLDEEIDSIRQKLSRLS